MEVKNYFTGNYSCANGFVGQLVVGECPPDWKQCIQPRFCYNKSISLSESIIGGMYTTSSDESGKHCEQNNPYTGGKYCPNDFDAFNMGQTACGSHPGMY